MSLNECMNELLTEILEGKSIGDGCFMLRREAYSVLRFDDER